jgi:hypothetical protein
VRPAVRERIPMINGDFESVINLRPRKYFSDFPFSFELLNVTEDNITLHA